MNDRIQNHFLRPQPLAAERTQHSSAANAAAQIPASSSFGAVFQQQLQNAPTPQLTFSGHALQRMQQRQISLSTDDRQALADAAAKAREKGANETLILADKGAFLVSVRNNTVITVMDKENMKDNLFTQIDSAIII